jgi:AraC-like DNA-binding protein
MRSTGLGLVRACCRHVESGASVLWFTVTVMSVSKASASRSSHDALMWRTGDLGGLELFRATLTEFAFSPHAHEEFFIAMTEGGLATPTFRGDTHVIGVGDVIVLNPEEAHAGGPPSDGSWTYRALYPDPALMRQITREFTGHRPTIPAFGGNVVRDRDVTGALRRFHSLSERAGSTALERESELVEALVLLVGRHAAPVQAPRSPGRERRAVRLSRAYLEEHAAENVTLTNLARVAGISPFHLCRVFGRAVGMTPHAYQTHIRIRRAKSLLRAGTAIAIAAAEVGFYDQAHLTRHFKRIVGLTPMQYAIVR